MTSTSTNIDQMMSKVAEQIATAKANAQAMAEMTGKGETEEGKIVVTVNPTGALVSIELDPRAMRMASTDLAGAIVAASEIAKKDAADQVRALWSTADTGGLDMADVAQGNVDLSATLDERLAAAQDALRKYR